MADIYIVGETIAADKAVILHGDGKLYSSFPTDGTCGLYMGKSVEQLRQGFKARAHWGEWRENDA